MKDAQGHGSNIRGGSPVLVRNGASAHGIIPSRPYRQSGANDGGGQPMSSNRAAGDALMSALKSTQAPVHDSMASYGPDSSGAHNSPLVSNAARLRVGRR